MPLHDTTLLDPHFLKNLNTLPFFIILCCRVTINILENVLVHLTHTVGLIINAILLLQWQNFAQEKWLQVSTCQA